jgi:predicted HicB family RNase H-like nuclease
MAQTKTKETQRKFMLRLDDDVREALAAEAKRNERSVTAEIRLRLRRSIEAQLAATAA